MLFETGEILHTEIGDYREVDRCSGKLEGLLAERGLAFLESQGLHIAEVVTDASRTFIKMFGMYFSVTITKYTRHYDNSIIQSVGFYCNMVSPL